MLFCVPSKSLKKKSNSTMNNLVARILTAIVGVGILLTAILYSQWSYMVIFLLISLLTTYEFYQLGQKAGRNPFRTWGLISSALLFGLAFLYVTNAFEVTYLLFFLAFLSSIVGLSIFRKNKEHLISSMSFSVLGVAYIGLPFAMLNFLAFPDGSYHFDLVIGLLFCQWANDTGGYFAGKAFGKHKLYESVSPNKTIEGSVGGIILSSAVAVGLFYIFADLTLMQWLGLALIVSIFGSIGDLAESQIKRNLAIKDSGSILPGHGGFLDRFDGLLLALPFATLYIHLII